MKINPTWPPIDTEWSQADLGRWVRQMGIIPDPFEILPQGVKYVAWPQRRPTEDEIKYGQSLERELKAGRLKPIAVIKRRRDPRKN